MHRRASGVLLHVTSLPSRYGIGDFGPGARQFARFLVQAGQAYWQILPLAPTSTFIGNSPYSSDSAFAVNPLFISPEVMVADGWLTEPDIGDAAPAHSSVAEYEASEVLKDRLVRLAFTRCRQRLATDDGFRTFCRDEASWLDDYALFRTVKALQSTAAMAGPTGPCPCATAMPTP